MKSSIVRTDRVQENDDDQCCVEDGSHIRITIRRGVGFRVESSQRRQTTDFLQNLDKCAAEARCRY